MLHLDFLPKEKALYIHVSPRRARICFLIKKIKYTYLPQHEVETKRKRKRTNYEKKEKTAMNNQTNRVVTHGYAMVKKERLFQASSSTDQN